MKTLQSLRARARTLGMVATVGAVVAAASLLVAGCQSAASYPSKPILFVVPYAPGGGSDIIIRVFDKTRHGNEGDPPAHGHRE